MEIKLDIVVKDEVLGNIITTAIEGASNYWYFLNEDACDIIRSNSEGGKPFSVRILDAVKNGAEIPVHDIEDTGGERIGVLSSESIRTGLQKIMDDEVMQKFLMSEIEGNGDGESSDVVFQFMVMGEYVYG
jgi:hypothetical protein